MNKLKGKTIKPKLNKHVITYTHTHKNRAKQMQKIKQ